MNLCTSVPYVVTYCFATLLGTMATCTNCDVKKRTAVLSSYLRGGEMMKFRHELLSLRKGGKLCVTEA
jgi:hypothetical protein